jgi:hypothetical protein
VATSFTEITTGTTAPSASGTQPLLAPNQTTPMTTSDKERISQRDVSVSAETHLTVAFFVGCVWIAEIGGTVVSTVLRIVNYLTTKAVAWDRTWM